MPFWRWIYNYCLPSVAPYLIYIYIYTHSFLPKKKVIWLACMALLYKLYFLNFPSIEILMNESRLNVFFLYSVSIILMNCGVFFMLVS